VYFYSKFWFVSSYTHLKCPVLIMMEESIMKVFSNTIIVALEAIQIILNHYSFL